MDKFTIGSSPTDLKRTYTEAFYAAVPDVESYQPIKEVSIILSEWLEIQI
jgi:hypothetical protein